MYFYLIIYLWKGFIVNRHAFTLFQQSLSPAAQVHLCHRVTQPVISTNIAVKGAAGLLFAQECRWAGSLVMPVLLGCFLFSSTDWIWLKPCCQYNCTAVQSSIPAEASLIKSCFGPLQLAVGLLWIASELSTLSHISMNWQPMRGSN